MKVVGVHGVHNFRVDIAPNEPSDLDQTWESNLRRGFGASSPEIDLRVGYYADLIRSPIQQGTNLEGNVTAPELKAIRSWAASLGVPSPQTMGRGTAWLRSMGSWIAQREGLNEEFLSASVVRFFREVVAYMSDSAGCRQRAQDRVISVLYEHQPAIVIAHSLGSVVAYEALWANPSVKVDLLVTVGSPLGMPGVVLEKLIPTQRARPPGVRHWLNLADVGDIVAIPKGLCSNFSGVDADLTTAIHAFDFHRVANYLKAPPVVAALVPYC